MKNRFHWEEIRKLAMAHQLEEPTSSTEALLRFLRWWWCSTYNKPLKDPLLMSYTADELTYEFLRHYYAKPENDPKKKIEAEQAAKDDEEWIAKMLQKNAAGASVQDDNQSESQEKLEEPRANAEMPALPEISAKFDPNI